MRERLIGNLYRAFDQDPAAGLALRLQAPGGLAWRVANRTLTLEHEAGGLIGEVDLAGKTIAEVADLMPGLGVTVGYESVEFGARAADSLLAGDGRESASNGDHLYLYDTLLWALCDAYASELETADAMGIVEGLKQAYLHTAAGGWLDYWGSYFGVWRETSENDADYLDRIIVEVIRPRNNAVAIESAIRDIVGVEVYLREPWKEIFTLNYSALSGAHHFQDGNFYTWNVFQPIVTERVAPEVLALILRVIERNRPVGCLVVDEGVAYSAMAVVVDGTPTVAGLYFSGTHSTLVANTELSVLDDGLALSDTDQEFDMALGRHLVTSEACATGYEVAGWLSGIVGHIPGSPPVVVGDPELSEAGHIDSRGNSLPITSFVTTWQDTPNWSPDTPWGNGSVMVLNELFRDAWFAAPLRTSLILAQGAGNPTFSRGSPASVRDFEGLWRTVPANCARFGGARLVRNLATASEDWTHAGWTKASCVATTGTLTATAGNATCLQSYTAASSNWVLRVRLSRISGSGSIQLTLDGGAAWTTVAVSGVNQVFSIAQTGVANPQFGIRIVASGDAVNATEIQLEQTNGQANTNPSEYVSNGTLPAPYHGAGVDGIKWFDRANGNTVVGNIVTEALGALIERSTTNPLMLLKEGGGTNYLTYSNDCTNAAWVKTNITAALTATGPDGVANSASTLTATAANGTCLQTLTRASAVRVSGVLIKRRTGTGNIDVTQDGGTTWTTLAVTSSWQWLAIPKQTHANPALGFRIVTSGDSVDLWCVQHEEAPELTSPIPTTTAAASRGSDVLTYPMAGNIDDTVGTISAECFRPYSEATLAASAALVVVEDVSGRLYMDASSNAVAYDGTNWTTKTGLGDISAGIRKRAISYAGSVMLVTGDGAAPQLGTFDGNMGAGGSSNIEIGAADGGGDFNGYLGNIYIWPTGKNLPAITAP